MNFVLCSYVIGIFIIVFIVVNFRNKSKKPKFSLDKDEDKIEIDTFSNIIVSRIKIYRSIGYAFRGNHYLKLGKYSDALHDLLESIRLVQLPAINMGLMGELFYAVNEYNRAFNYYSKAVNFKPKSSSTHLSLGLFYFRTKEYNKAIESFNTSLKCKNNKRNKKVIYASLGVTYIKLKEYDKASKSLSKSWDIEPENYSACIGYANLHRIKGDFLLAKDYALKAINQNAHEYGFYKILAEINLMENNYIDFYKNFKTFLDRKFFNFDYEYIKDSIYDKVRNEDEFKSLIEKKMENIILFNDLNCFIDDDKLISYKRYKKQKSIYYIEIVSFVLIIILATLSITKL
ncbi:hypothetical protein KPL35_16585 [Clostridium sp. CF011]|uniref:tetratricopeptide repeat protein n=1 Tax=Clostridium sp. CF011 TaxID=2843318 RepID=UPI001C0D04D7|nr:CDC27 family protein [Clostridium sp. CF011]MBU3093674.1 hypothetical protein [Clostridium sp. CF011]WAG70669.1 hypothetical protein LL036_04315 [Clostridium sp. CF011]